MWQSRKYQKEEISHILETSSRYTTDSDEKNEFASQNVDTRNKSVVGQNVKKNKKIMVYIGNLAKQRASPYSCP